MSFALTIARHAERSRLWEMTAPLVSDNLPPAARAAWAAMQRPLVLAQAC